MLLRQIAYDSLGRTFSNPDDIRVYIREKGIWQPFLVLTANYMGSDRVLLLRMHIMDESIEFLSPETHELRTSTNRRGIQYYPNSDIDIWLNTEYINSFSQSIKENILTTEIVVWDGQRHEEPLGFWHQRGTEIVEKRVFLLSAAEVGAPVSRNDPVDGQFLAYFKRNDRLVTTQKGEIAAWWLRSVYSTVIGNTVAIIGGLDGESFAFHTVNYNPFTNLPGMRPAFTLPSDTNIELYAIGVGGKVYVIHN